ncbi:pseudouridine synthase [Canariomyces notabilis]|uniref:Pseudouridine synthase n=1 Tax=Canariomyces notabilis TaxID=2074819 RepID=A0AAN6YV66_9PEZI|nr:pseudouridine synthase [Canariomyces arenarius]
MSQRPGLHVPAIRLETEKNLGITQRSAAINFGWTGEIRKRYTDFLVNEIRVDGTVLHLHKYEEVKSDKPDTQAQQYPGNGNASANTSGRPDDKPQVHRISENDRQILMGLIGEAIAQRLIDLDEKTQAKTNIPPNGRSVVFDAITDRAARAKVHQEIRRIFHSRIETVANSAGIITATASKSTANRGGARQRNGPQRDNNRSREISQSFEQLGGNYLHFTMYKENKDTMDAINTIARLLKVKASFFGFAGTKDRRAATVQRISVYQQKASDMIWLNTRINNVKVGDFEYAKAPLQLGDHGGNEFIITVKNCQPLPGTEGSVVHRMRMIQRAVECGLAYLKYNGYLNYFGLQRFGTHSIGTHKLGMKLLKSDWEGFIDDVLHVDDHLIQQVLNNTPQTCGTGKELRDNRDDFNRARAITTWKTTKNADKALEVLPKRFSSEYSIIQHLGKNPRDFLGAIQSITRGMRRMYAHAYQSYVWNYVATRRWSKYGSNVVEGDLVVVSSGRSPDGSDAEFSAYDDFEDDNAYAQARSLTAEDVASGQYTIFDVVLPNPGYDVMYPRNDIGDYYVEFMGREENGCLNPYEMRRKHREFSLSGNYRPLIGRFMGEPQYAIKAYCDDLEQMHPTDLDYALHQKEAEKKAVASSVDSWAHFAKNAAAYDDAMATARRRKADAEPAPNGDSVINETWIQTGLNGSDKRVKLARHHQTFDNAVGSEWSSGHSASTAPSLEAEEPGHSTDDVNTMSAEASGGVSLLDTTQDESPRPTTVSDLIPMVRISDEPMPASGMRGVSDTYYRSIGKMPSLDGLGALDSNIQMPVTGGGTAQTPPPGDGALQTGTELINNVALPKLNPVSANPLFSVDDSIDESSIDPKATKIAVILKFQLKVSNYATIVLRELMGTDVE